MVANSEKLTVADLRNVSAAYDRGYKHAMEKLGDGATRLRKAHLPEEHDRIHADLSAWLAADRFNFRAPGVVENLFRLSDYVSGRTAVPPKGVLTFLHAYIFALEAQTSRVIERKRSEKKRGRRPIGRGGN